ncbi:MAG: lysoplasmalogenase [Bacteroidales bacterium]|nr:lysoplasmalogenase [Bacteroidales bacterium]
MNKNYRLWLIPLAFFLVCCGLNLAGCLNYEDHTLERTVKPALLILLALTSAAWLLPRSPRPRETALLLTAQLFGFAGDTMLLGNGFFFFAGGIGLFLIGHAFYITLFGGGHSLRGLKPLAWILGVVLALACTAGLVIGLGVNGSMLVPMSVYAFTLSVLILSALAGVIRFGGLTWWFLLAGALLFTFSDSLIAVRTFGSLSPFMDGFVIMATYLAAQGLLAAGCCRLATEK